MDQGTAVQYVTYELPGTILELGITSDRRGIPLLRRALLSRNTMIESSAARGLAEINDKDSIPLIVATCKRAPASSATAIAWALVYFDTPEAQAAVDLYMPKDFAKAAREARTAGEGPFGEKGWH
jgi:HEAT repeat protein